MLTTNSLIEISGSMSDAFFMEITTIKLTHGVGFCTGAVDVMLHKVIQALLWIR